MTPVEACERNLKKAVDKFDTLMERLTRASGSNSGDLQNQIDELVENIFYLQQKLKEAQANERVLQRPSQTAIYCYVFTNRLTEIEDDYEYEEQKACLKKRYHSTNLKDWQPFETKMDPITIEDILGFCKNKYHFEVVYWESKQQHYTQLDERFSQTFAILDLLAFGPRNERGFRLYDRKVANYVAPNCSQTYSLFTKTIEATKSEFMTTPTKPSFDVDMDFFDRSSVQQLQATIYYFLDELSGNIYNESKVDSPIRGMDFNLNAK